jgi:ribosomal protein S18 acetylase RimI-like enzyme
MAAPEATYVATDPSGEMVGTSEMCRHSQEIALELGFNSMQFNLVVSTNEGAVRQWKEPGFEIVGAIPGAFNHPTLGFVDAYVMIKKLAGAA